MIGDANLLRLFGKPLFENADAGGQFRVFGIEVVEHPSSTKQWLRIDCLLHPQHWPRWRT